MAASVVSCAVSMKRTDILRWLKGISYIGIYGGLLLPLVFIPVVIFPFVFSKLIFFQVLIGLTFPAYAALAWMEPKYRPRWKPLYGAIFAYFLAIGLSVVFAIDPLRAWWGNQERMNGLFTVLHFFLWMTMLVSVLKTWDQWKKILGYQIVLSVFMACVALLQIPFPKLLLFQAGPRVGGLLDNPIYMAGYQIFSFFLIALLWMKTESKTVRILLGLALLFDAGAFMVAQSRGALLGLAVGIVAFGGMWVLLSKNRKAKAGVMIAVVAFFSLYGVAYTLKEQPFIKETPMYRLLDLRATTETRFIAWKIAWNGFLERPLTGWGYDNFHILFNKKYNPESLRFGYYETWFDRAHNTVMDTLAMTGLLGILTYTSIWGALFYSVFRAYRKGWIDAPFASVLTALPVAYFVQNLFVFDQPAGFTMSFFMYAFIIASTSGEFVGKKEKEEIKADTEKGKTFPIYAFSAVQLIALVIVWRYSVVPFRISRITIQSNNYFAAGLLQQSFDLAKQAASMPTPYLDEQTFLQSRNLMSIVDANALGKVPIWKEWYALVKDVTERHLAEHPNNTHPHFIYARFLQTFAKSVPEDAALAEKEYLKSIETSPTRQQLYFSLARLYLEQGKKQQAFDVFKKAAELDSEVGESLWYAGLTQMFDLGQMDLGAKLVAQSVKVKAPYAPKDVREATALAIAFSTVGDVDGFKTMMATLSTLSNGTAPLYLDIARSAEKLGLIQERNQLLQALIKADPTLAIRFTPLQNGSATSINDALMLTTNVTTTAPVPTTTSKAPEATAPVPAASIATSSDSSAGPRMRR